MKKFLKMLFGFNFIASKDMIKGGSNTGGRDSANSYYYYDGSK